MDVSYNPLLVDDQLCWHPSQFEPFDLLAVDAGNSMAGVSQSLKGNVVFLPIGLELISAVRADGDHNGISRDELIMILAQLRHVPAAEWSIEATVEDQHDMRVPGIVRDTDHLATRVL